MSGIINFFTQIGNFIKGFIEMIKLLNTQLTSGLVSINALATVSVPDVCLGLVLLVLTVFVLGVILDIVRDIF